MNIWSTCSQCGKTMDLNNDDAYLIAGKGSLLPACGDCVLIANPNCTAQLIVGHVNEAEPTDTMPFAPVVVFQGCTVEEVNEQEGKISMSYKVKK